MSTSILEPTTAPPTSANKPSADEKTIGRRHDLDALRAIAMLLGIVLHGALAFAPIPWAVNDTQQSEVFYWLFAFIHGFRMPLFFMLSGFFTAMMWRKRGLLNLIKHRLLRIALPLLIGCCTIIPAMWIVFSIASIPSPASTGSSEVWEAVFAGDAERVQTGIAAGEIRTNDLHPSSGTTLLSAAVFFGHQDVVEVLINEGADVNQRSRDNGTPLHVAAFMGRAELASKLLDAGADKEARDGNNSRPQDLLAIDFATTYGIAKPLGVELEEQELIQGRTETAKVLGVADPFASGAEGQLTLLLNGVVGLLFQFPVFMHLWFLWFLCWLVAAFVIYSLFADRLNTKLLSKRFVCSPLNLLILIPLTMCTQYFMQPSSFGPDSSVGLLPIPSVLGYYAIFFFFGAIYWDMEDSQGQLGRRWYVSLPLATFVVFPIALDFVSGSIGIVPKFESELLKVAIANFLQALFVWLMVSGSIGLFRQLVPTESRVLRYISDSSYWLYLAHLPLIILAQWLIRDWAISPFLKFALVIVPVTAILLVSYRYGVRYTIIGRLLNGPRKKGPSVTLMGKDSDLQPS